MLCCRGKGDPSKGEEAFRVNYDRLGEIRSLLGRKVPFITLTATARKETLEAIISDLGMTDCVKVVGNPNKANIRYTVINVECSLYSNFHWLIEHLELHGEQASRYLIFCRKKENVSGLFEIFPTSLGDNAYSGHNEEGGNDYRNRLFAMYHSKTDLEIQAYIRESFSVPHGKVRVLFCTTAFSMGVNPQGVYNVIHYGPANDTDDYLQETGRAGRDGTTQSHAILLKYKHSLGSQLISTAMKAYVTNRQTCRRVNLLKEFWEDINPELPLHSCCDICSSKCRCYCVCSSDSSCSCTGSCDTGEYMSTAEHLIRTNLCVNHETWENDTVVHSITPEQRHAFYASLMDYRYSLLTELSPEKLVTGIDIATGISVALIQDVTQHMDYVSHPDILRNRFTFFSDLHVQATWDILCSIIEDDEDDSIAASDEDSDIEITAHHDVVVLTSSDEDST